MRVSPLEGMTFGARVAGVDVSAMDRSTYDRLLDAFHEYGVLIVEDQDLDRDAQVAFAERLGPIELQDAKGLRAELEGQPIVLDISNVDQFGNHIADRNHPQTRYLGGNEDWHTDSSFKPVTALASVLHAIEVPTNGGNTWWADMRAAHDALEAAEQLRLRGLEAYHSLEYAQAVAGAIDVRVPDDPTQMQGAWHPMVVEHPVTGRPALFVGRHAVLIRGMGVAESQAYLDDLIGRACRPPRTYEHSWTPGDVVMWDNRRVVHRATSWDLRERRVLRHVRVAGDAAYPHAGSRRHGVAPVSGD